jgi:hypothetical protein
MSQQLALKYTWKTMVALSPGYRFVFWDLRLSIACAQPRTQSTTRTSRQHSQPPRRGAAAPSRQRPQLCATHFAVPRCRRREDQHRRVVVSMSGAHSSMKPPYGGALTTVKSHFYCFILEIRFLFSAHTTFV